jgi:hypothetical protein
MKRLFISFRAQTDLALAESINRILRESGYETFFYPDSSRIGDDYELETRSGLERCDKVVVVGTSSYFDFATPTIPLLILHGLEPHQRRTEPDLGAINDRALSWFLDAFITRAPGAKMIITSHVMPKNLEGYATNDRAVRTVSLGRLDHADSVLMLIDGGIRRKSPDIDTFARECQGEP